MFSIFPGKRLDGPIGCAWSDGAIRLVQLHNAIRSGARVETAEAIIDHHVVSGDTLPDYSCKLKSLLEEADFTGTQAVAILPPSRVSCRRLRLAPMPDAELSAAVRWQLARELSRDANSLRCDYYVAGELTDSGKRRVEVIAFAATCGDIDAFTRQLAAAGLDAVAIDVVPGAIGRCVSAATPNDGDAATRLVLDVGECCSTLMTFARGQPRFVRTLPLGIACIAGQVACDSVSATPTPATAAIGVFASEAAREISLCLRYLGEFGSADAAVEAGCLLGAGGCEAALIERLNRDADVEFRLLTDTLPAGVAAILQQLPTAAADRHAWLTPLGLALYGRESLVTEAAA